MKRFPNCISIDYTNLFPLKFLKTVGFPLVIKIYGYGIKCQLLSLFLIWKIISFQIKHVIFLCRNITKCEEKHKVRFSRFQNYLRAMFMFLIICIYFYLLQLGISESVFSSYIQNRTFTYFLVRVCHKYIILCIWHTCTHISPGSIVNYSIIVTRLRTNDLIDFLNLFFYWYNNTLYFQT